MRRATVNVGERQQGRVSAESVLDCDPNRASIVAAIRMALSDDFRTRLPKMDPPYESDGNVSERIKNVLKTYPLEPGMRKYFYRPDVDNVTGPEVAGRVSL